MKSTQFWDWYDATAAHRLGYRTDTFKAIFEHLDSLAGPVVIVETGCVRQADNWAGDGQSTVLFDRYALTHPGSFVHTIDLDPQATAYCRTLVSDAVTVHTGDSVAVLRHIAKLLHMQVATVDLLYLDSYDVDFTHPTPSAVHHLKELISISDVLTKETLVVVDDSPSTARVIPLGPDSYRPISVPVIGGKGLYVAEYAQQIGATAMFSGYQVGWTGLSKRLRG